MKRLSLREARRVSIFKEIGLGAKIGETCRKHGISELTCYKRKSRFTGMTVSPLPQLRQLQEESAKRQRMCAAWR